MASYYQCPGCGSIMQDDPESIVITCKNCGSTITKVEQMGGIARLKAENRKTMVEDRELAMKEQEQKHEHKFGIIFFIVIIAVVAIWVLSTTIPHNARVRELEALVIEIEQDISNGDYDSALLKVNRVRLDDHYSEEENKKWNDEREYLIKVITDSKQAN